MANIALDAMGGDHAPAQTVAGAAAASLDKYPVHVLLVGPEATLRAELAKHPHNAEHLSFVNASQAVPMDAKPKAALDSLPDASVLVCARLVAEGRAQAMVSAGNTGAVILACSRTWPRLEGVRRCALAAVLPTERRRGIKNDPFSLVLDVGATLEASPEDLVAFAVMGSAYASRISQNSKPLIALLSNGTEPTKGRPAIVAAHHMLKAHPAINFIGNVEGVDLPRGSADVVITDGFTGNVVLKMLEGISETVRRLARYAAKESMVWKAGMMLLAGGIRELKQATDWQEYGGAPILGFDGICIKAHGRSNARAVHNAIRVAAKAVRTDLVNAMKEGLRRAAEIQLPEGTVPAPDSAVIE